MEPKKKKGAMPPAIGEIDKDTEIVLSNMDVYDRILSGSHSSSVPELVFKITQESVYVDDPNNSKLKIIKDWYQRVTVDNQTQIINFVKDSSL